MDYKKYKPHIDLASFINCYWTLKIPKQIPPNKQRIIPDGYIEMAFILGNDIKRYTGKNEYILQPRAMVLGHTMKPFYIEPTGYVDTFAIQFHPYGFSNFISHPINVLSDTETPINKLFEEKVANDLEQKIIKANNTLDRILIVENFFLNNLNKEKTRDKIIENTINTFFSTKGNILIHSLSQENESKRRQLERKFRKQIGISPKQLGKVIRLQTALQMICDKKSPNLTDIAHKTKYYDQAHFIKDFKEFTGVSPKDFFTDESLELSRLFL